MKRQRSQADGCPKGWETGAPPFELQSKGFATPDAVLTGVETRTSSPLLIPGGHKDFQSFVVCGLYPAGEGAGYADGVMSAGVDGIEVAEPVARSLLPAMAAATGMAQDCSSTRIECRPRIEPRQAS